MKSPRLLLLLGLTACFAANAIAQMTYTYTDLGTLGGTYAQAFDLNASGQVTGASNTGSGVSPFLYSGGVLSNLGTGFNYGNAINASGQIAGYLAAGNGDQHATLYSSGVTTDIGALIDPSLHSYATGINDAGLVVGYNYGVGGNSAQAFLYNGGVLTDLGTFGGGFTYAEDINATGQIVGTSKLNDGTNRYRAFIYDGGVMTSLGGPQFGHSQGVAINNAGQAVGWMQDTYTHAFIYSGGALVDLNTLAGVNHNSSAFDINNSGQVVGMSDFTGGSGTHAFLYSSGSMTDLNLVIANSTGGDVLKEAWAINDAGQIVGYTSSNHAFLLTPVPEPSAYAAFAGLGALGLGLWRKRQRS